MNLIEVKYDTVYDAIVTFSSKFVFNLLKGKLNIEVEQGWGEDKLECYVAWEYLEALSIQKSKNTRIFAISGKPDIIGISQLCYKYEPEKVNLKVYNQLKEILTEDQLKNYQTIKEINLTNDQIKDIEIYSYSDAQVLIQLDKDTFNELQDYI